MEFDFLCVLYVDGVDQKIPISRVNHSVPEDCIVMDLFKISQVTEIYSLDNLISCIDYASMFIAVSDPDWKPNCYYSCTTNVVQTELNSTAGEVRNKFKARFPGSVKPMVILKLYYTRKKTPTF